MMEAQGEHSVERPRVPFHKKALLVGAPIVLLLVLWIFVSSRPKASFVEPVPRASVRRASSLVDSGCCTFASHFEGVDWRDAKVRHRYLANVLAVERRFFAAPDVAFDADSGMTYDGTSLDMSTGAVRPDGLRLFSAASKEALHLSLLAVALQKPEEMAPELRTLLPLVYGFEEALEVLEKKVSSLEDFDHRYPAFGGFLPWFCSRGVNGDGTCKGLEDHFDGIEPKSDKLSLPALDNGQMAWAIAALVQALRKSGDSRVEALRKRWEGRLQRMKDTAVNLFYDGPGTGTVRAIATLKNSQVDAATSSVNAYNKENYVLWDPYEGEMIVLFLDLMGNWSNFTSPEAEKAKIWSIKAQHVDSVFYNDSNHETYVIQEGFWFSSHEQWKILQLPYLQIPLVRHLFTNGEMARLAFSREQALNGLLASVNAPVGFECDSASGAYCSALGIQSFAEQPILTDHVLTPYGAFPAILIEPAAGLAWYNHMLRMPRAQTALGSIESFTQSGEAVAPIVTWDAKVTSVLAMLGGTGTLVRQYLEGEKRMDIFVKRVQTMYEQVFHQPIEEVTPAGMSLSTRIAMIPQLPMPQQAVPSAAAAPYQQCGCTSA